MLFVTSAIVAAVSSAILVQASPVDLSSITSKSGGLAQVITQCTVSGTAALTFDDVRAFRLPNIYLLTGFDFLRAHMNIFRYRYTF